MNWIVRSLVVVISLSMVTVAKSNRACACYAIVVGRKASVDGSVLFAHAEQNRSPRMLNFRRIPAIKHDAGDKFLLGRGGQIDETTETAAYLWSELPGVEFSDNQVNEFGVAVSSDSCPSREDSYEDLVKRGDIRDGGVGGMLRRVVVQRAHSARQGVELAGKLIEQFGYVDAGRTYTIADPHEAWLLAVVRGKHWVARRVPDDRVVVLSNVYVIDEVDLNDTKNYLGSKDLVEYATRRGWYKPSEDGAFRFDAAYGAHRGAPDKRRWRGLQLVAGHDIAWPYPPIGFAIAPSKKLSVADVAEMLSTVTPYDRVEGFSSQEGAVFQLRDNMPKEIGCVYWRTSGEPSMNIFLPWYVGIEETPKNYYRETDLKETLSLEHHFRPAASIFEPNTSLAWWLHQSLQDNITGKQQARLPEIQKVWKETEKRIFANQPIVEKSASEMWTLGHQAARATLTQYCKTLAAQVDLEVHQLLLDE